MQRLPIVYVRGYAGTQAEVEQTVDDPFYGLNLGSTHIRQGESGDADFYVFESPLVRLISDYGYSEVFDGYTQEITRSVRDPLATIWIHRYYDQTSRTFDRYDKGVRLTVYEAAKDLMQFIDRIRETVHYYTGEPSKVYLIAHSMGGLVCRSLIQRVYRENGLEAKNYIDKFFTYGTPHGGIHFDFPGGGGVEKLRDILGINQSDAFGPKRLYEFLTMPDDRDRSAREDFDPTYVGEDVFNPDRIFCIVGTNAKDYDVLYGLSRTAVGPQSDGLVQIESASVRSSHRAYIHRSHSGRYGMVNSEEAFQNLERFLFGEIKAKAVFCNFEFDFHVDNENTIRTYFVETRVAVRNLPVSMHERSLEHLSAVPLNAEQYQEQMKKGGLPLYTSFLIIRDEKQNGNVDPAYRKNLPPMRHDQSDLQYMIRLAVYREDYEKHTFLKFRDHIERLPLWSDYLVIRLEPTSEASDARYRVFARWNSDGPFEKEVPPETVEDRIDYTVRLPYVAAEAFGKKAAIRFETSDWE